MRMLLDFTWALTVHWSLVVRVVPAQPKLPVGAMAINVVGFPAVMA